jgi:hypothetical protein
MTAKPAYIEFADRYKYGEWQRSITVGFVSGGEVEFGQANYSSYDWLCTEYTGVFIPKKGEENVGLLICEWDLYLVDMEAQKATEIRGDEIDHDDYPGCEHWLDVRAKHLAELWD